MTRRGDWARSAARGESSRLILVAIVMIVLGTATIGAAVVGTNDGKPPPRADTGPAPGFTANEEALLPIDGADATAPSTTRPDRSGSTTAPPTDGAGTSETVASTDPTAPDAPPTTDATSPFVLATPTNRSPVTTTPAPSATTRTIPGQIDFAPSDRGIDNDIIPEVNENDSDCVAARSFALAGQAFDRSEGGDFAATKAVVLALLRRAATSVAVNSDPVVSAFSQLFVGMVDRASLSTDRDTLGAAMNPVRNPTDPNIVQAILIIGRHLRDNCPQLGVAPPG